MATQPISVIEQALERIISNPIRASLTVGTSIVVLLEVVHRLMLTWPVLGMFLYLVPFIPPYVISRTALRINQRITAHNFIKDAIPYVFVAYPKDASVESLLSTKPEMISDSAAQHFNHPIAALLNDSVLPPAFFKNAGDRTSLIAEFVRDYEAHFGYGVIHDYRIAIQPHGQNTPHDYLVNGVLKKQGKRIKWQATMMRYGVADGTPTQSETFAA